MLALSALLPIIIGLVLVVIGVFAHDPEVRNIGIGFLGGGTTTGAVHATTPSRRL